jgi:hypothetical protein
MLGAKVRLNGHDNLPTVVAPHITNFTLEEVYAYAYSLDSEL